MRKFFCIFCLAVASISVYGAKRYVVSDYGLRPGSSANASVVMSTIIEQIKVDGVGGVIVFERGRYDFRPDGASIREYYISNHDQDNPKVVGMAFEGLKNVRIEGNGADFIFHGRMLPLAVVGCEGFAASDISIDFAQPHIAQVTITENDTLNKTITYKVAPWVDFEIRNGRFYNKGEGWMHEIGSCIAFEGDTRRIVYRTSDIYYGQRDSEMLDKDLVRVKWDYPALVPGTVLALRGGYRPAPGIFVADSKNTTLENTTVHYAEGMGLLAQMSENITLRGFNVSLRGDNDPRYFTTQADATHFSGCKGKIISNGGLYEGMMDDAINIHGTYLKILKRIDEKTVEAAYMHPQSWGFRWGEVGDKVQFIEPQTMELVGKGNSVKSIKPLDKPTVKGAKRFEISFAQPLDVSVKENCGIENLTWTPSVQFAGNMVRNNRARGALFSTPKPTVIENNIFDHTSGTAILLCGDCNGWFETGACKSVIIRGNRFVNALTSMFQFTNGVISIYPEIPNLAGQTKYFHGGGKNAILIEGNIFEVFDKPLVYAKSVDGLVFRNNSIKTNSDYVSFHDIRVPFLFERVVNWTIQGNTFDNGFDESTDVVVR